MQPPSLKIGDRLVLVFRKNLGEHLVDTERRADRVRDLAGVARDHDDADSESVELTDGVRRFWPDLVFKGQGADDLVVANDMEDRRPPAVATCR